MEASRVVARRHPAVRELAPAMAGLVAAISVESPVDTPSNMKRCPSRDSKVSTRAESGHGTPPSPFESPGRLPGPGLAGSRRRVPQTRGCHGGCRPFGGAGTVDLATLGRRRQAHGTAAAAQAAAAQAAAAAALWSQAEGASNAEGDSSESGSSESDSGYGSRPCLARTMHLRGSSNRLGWLAERSAQRAAARLVVLGAESDAGKSGREGIEASSNNAGKRPQPTLGSSDSEEEDRPTPFQRGTRAPATSLADFAPRPPSELLRRRPGFPPSDLRVKDPRSPKPGAPEMGGLRALWPCAKLGQSAVQGWRQSQGVRPRAALMRHDN